MVKKERISVVLAAHYRPEFLKKTLKAVLGQDYPKEMFEVIVVGFEGDKSLDLVEKEFGSKNTTFFRINSTFVDKKRNFGVKKAKFGIIAFTDDDCIPQKTWLSEISKCFCENPKTSGVEGFTWNDNKELYCHAPENLSGDRFLACNYAFKKSAFEQVKGFDEQYHMNYREDTDLAFKMLEKGMKIEFCRRARVFHPPIRQKMSIPLRDLKLVRNDILLYKKFPGLFKERFGFVCRGFFKLSGLAWIAALFAAGTIYYGIGELALLSLLALIGLKVFVEKRGKKANVLEWVMFIVFSYIRDLLFPFSFVYYWLTVRPTRKVV